MTVITVRVPASSANLGPGFDALGLALQLSNQLSLSESDRDSLEVAGEGRSELQNQTSTIAHQAAHRVFEKLNLQIAGVHLQLENQIPLSRGLGSSSAAIVGAMVAANQWARQKANRGLETGELLDLANALEGHPDNVAPALLGGFVAAAVDEMGKVSAVKIPVERFPRFVVWVPDAHLPTETARGVLPASFSRADAVFNLSRAALLVGALASGKLENLGEALRDKIHQEQRAKLVPGWQELTEIARQNGALGATLSGAGPSILFWLSPDDSQNWSQILGDGATQNGMAGRAMELEVDLAGARVVSSE